MDPNLLSIGIFFYTPSYLSVTYENMLQSIHKQHAEKIHNRNCKTVTYGINNNKLLY